MKSKMFKYCVSFNLGGGKEENIERRSPFLNDENNRNETDRPMKKEAYYLYSGWDRITQDENVNHLLLKNKFDKKAQYIPLTMTSLKIMM